MANYFDRSIFLNEQSLLPIYEQVLKTPENLQKNIYFLEKAVETKNEKIVEHIIDKISDRFLIPAQKWLKIAQTFDENEKMFLKICEMGLKQFPTETLWIAYLLKLIKLKKLKKIDFELLSRKFDCAIDQIGFYSSKLLDVSKNLENEIKPKNFSEKRKSENWNNLNFENKFKTLTENSKKGKLDESETYFHFNSYVEAIKLNFKNDKNLTKFIKSIFERFIEHFYFFGIFWKEYLNFAEKFDDIKNIINVYERALKSNPDKFDFYENYFLFLEKNKMQNKIEEVALNAEKRKLCGENNIFIRFFPIVSKIRQLRLRKQNLTEQNLDKIREEMDKFYKTALKNKETKNCFEIFHFFGFVELKYFSDSAKAKFWINRNLEIFNNSVKAFTNAIKYEKMNGTEENARALAKKGLDRFKDDKFATLKILRIWKSVVWDCYTDLDLYKNDLKEISEIKNFWCSKRKPIFRRKEKKKIEKKQKFLMLENKISQKNQNSENKNLNKNGQDHTVFVVNLDHSSKDKEISQLFSQFGKIKRIKIPKKNDGSVKGYGYVTYKNTESAENAIKKLNLAKFKNGILNVQRSRNDQISKRTLFVKNLPKKDCEKELKALFGNFGEIEEIRRPQERSKNGGMKPFCYITFKNILSLEKALKNPKDDFRVKLGKVEKVIKIEKCEALGTQTRIYKERNMSKLTQKTKKLQIPVSVQIKRKKTLKLQNFKNGKNLNENVNLNENLSNEQFSQILNK